MSRSLFQSRKFQFFDIKEGKEILNNTVINDPLLSGDNEEKKEEIQIKINDIYPNQMVAAEGIVFISGYVKKLVDKSSFEPKGAKKEEDKDKPVEKVLIKEIEVLKIINNVVISEFKLFNKYCYGFLLKNYYEKPYFVSIGGDFDLHTVGKEKQYLLITSIKIFDAETIIRNRDKPENERNIEQFLKRKINLLYNKDKKSLFSSEFINSINIESVQDIISITINDNFTKLVVALDKGKIILVSGAPNLIECQQKDIKIRFLKPIDEDIHITNLAFGFVDFNKEVLYITTAKSIFVYFISEKEMSSDRIEDLNQGDPDNGAYSDCIAIDNDNFSLIVASKQESFIIEYIGLERGPSWFFEGKKQFLQYFKNYLVFAIYDEKSASIAIYDKTNKFFVYFNSNFSKIVRMCCDENNIYAFIQNEGNKTCIIKLTEKDNKDKFDTFYKKNFYDLAFDYAKNLNYDKKKLAEISKKHAEFAYLNKDYEKSIEQFKLTINYLDPSYVIQKFLDKTKLDYLILYLDALEKDETFKSRSKDEMTDYTALLVNCYIMQEKYSKLKEFVDNQDKNFLLEDVKTAIDVCCESGNEEIALFIANKKNMKEEYLKILINMKKYQEAFEYIQKEQNLEEKFKMITTYGDILFDLDETDLKPLKRTNTVYTNIKNPENNENMNNEEEEVEEHVNVKINYPEEIYNMCVDFITAIKEKPKEEKLNIQYENIIKVFSNHTDYLEKILNKILELDSNCDNSIIHRRIELYLENEDKSQRNKIIEMIKDPKYSIRIDSNYLLVLFKMRNFNEGIVELARIAQFKSELFINYLQNKNYNLILDFCIEFGNTDINYWKQALQFFVDNIDENEEYEENIKYLNETLSKIINIDQISPLEVLSILKKNPLITIETFLPFMQKALNDEKSNYADDKKEFEEKLKELEKVKQDIKDSYTKYVTIRPNKCAVCNISLSLPAKHFLCGHSFHSDSCNSDFDGNSKNECPLCTSKIRQLRNTINAKRAELANQNNDEFLKKLLDKTDRRFDVFSDKIGEGIINFDGVV